MTTFKRGDWVRWSHGEPPCIHPRCLFLKDLGDISAGIGMICNTDGNTFTVALDQLQPDEAPE